MNTNEQQLTYQTVPKIMTTEVCTLNINRSVQSSLSQVKALNVYQGTN